MGSTCWKSRPRKTGRSGTADPSSMRNKLILPDKFSFHTVIPVRITDVNYGGHVGNDTVLSILHEARVQFLNSLGYSEMDLAGVGMIMSNVTIEFRTELFYGDSIRAFVAASNLSRASFDIFYRLVKDNDPTNPEVALAKTGMVCYNYSRKKIVAIPEPALNKLK